MCDQTIHLITNVQCPHCGHFCAVGVEPTTFHTSHQIWQCDDAQDGGCNKPFVVTAKVSVKAVTFALDDDLFLD